MKFFISFLLLFSIILNAEDDLGFDDFEEDSEEVVVDTKKEQYPWLSGSTTYFTSYNYNQSKEPFDGFSSSKISLELTADKKINDTTKVKATGKASFDGIYSIKGRDKYSDELLADEEYILELKEFTISKSIGNKTDLKVGRQIVVWGKSDSLRVTDILNPMDITKMGVVDIEDLRLSLLMTKMDIYFGKWNISPIIIHENRFSKTPSFGSDFYSKPKKIEEEIPTNKQYAISINGQFKGYDISFYGASINSDTGHYDIVKQKRVHEPITMFGSAFNMTYGAFLLKAEAGFFSGFKIKETKDKTYNRSDYLLGFDYKGISDTTISLETTTKQYEALASTITSVNEKTIQTAFRATTDTMNATLTLNYLISVFGENFKDGGFQRVWAKYNFGGGLNSNFGVVDYIDDDSQKTFFSYIKDNDRIYCDVKYSF